ncbi:MAG: TIGR02147 family protein [Pseudobacteriovorax sp.]|nr:TIGR02147 family protein [Pseudobacteriovorax sp.]
MKKELLEQFTRTHKVTNYLDYRTYLSDMYSYLKSNSGKYSYLQMSDDFGFSRTNVLHLIIKGKRPLTEKSAEKILFNLPLDAAEKRYFKLLVAYQAAKGNSARDNLFEKLMKIKSKKLSSSFANIQLDFFQEWYHVVIYEMCAIEQVEKNPEIICHFLKPNIRPEQARKSLELLENLNLIEKTEEGNNWKQTTSHISTGDEIASLAVVSYHQNMIDLGKLSITEVSENLRDISSVCMAIPSTMVGSIKNEISQFRKKILALTESKTKNDAEVYHMNIQFFPSTHMTKKTKGKSSK